MSQDFSLNSLEYLHPDNINMSELLRSIVILCCGIITISLFYCNEDRHQSPIFEALAGHLRRLELLYNKLLDSLNFKIRSYDHISLACPALAKPDLSPLAAVILVSAVLLCFCSADPMRIVCETLTRITITILLSLETVALRALECCFPVPIPASIPDPIPDSLVSSTGNSDRATLAALRPVIHVQDMEIAGRGLDILELKIELAKERHQWKIVTELQQELGEAWKSYEERFPEDDERWSEAIISR